MSKKKGEEMKRERQIFLYGDEASGIPGCVKNGIDEQVANKIYDEMLDFANYAFISRMRPHMRLWHIRLRG